MSLLIRTTRVALLAAIAGCASSPPRLEPSAPRIEALSEPERAAHALSRLTFGARPGDAEKVAALGVDRWIERQLHPETIPDSALTVALAAIPAWSLPTNTASLTAQALPLASMTMAELAKDGAARGALREISSRLVAFGDQNDLFAGKIAHAQVSERQLLEVVSDFWENHFSVYANKMPSRETLVVFDRDVLRARAFGKFRDLLGAVAHSPAMLYYLDNQLSTSRGLNENYARELLELHTLGVDGGYTQQDVGEVARALTGWTIQPSGSQNVFAFRGELHDTGAKAVLGHSLRSGRGIEDGEEVLDILANHPSTARHIARKLARRLVSDDPPPALVARAAATFTRTDGDIAEVVRTIVTSPEFFSRAAFRAKVKTPLELVVSLRRALDAPADTTTATVRLVARLGQPTFGWPAPDGWPERGGAWMNSGTMHERVKFASDVAYGRGVAIEKWHHWAVLATMPFDRQVDGVVNGILAGFVEPATRDAMRATRLDAIDPSAIEGRERLRALLAIALASPEFQRR